MNIDAQQLKALRTAKAWTQQQLADTSGLSLRTIQRIERYGTGASESVLCIAAALDIDASTIISDHAFEVVEVAQSFSFAQLMGGIVAGGAVGATLVLILMI